MQRAAAFTCVFLGMAARAGSADGADNVKRECVQSATRGQRLRDEGKPLAARSQFLVCVQAACPPVIRSHCGRWLEEVGAAIPTVVVRARAGSAGHPIDITDVEVVADGTKAADSLDGRPLPLEPGEHTLRYARAGSPPIEERILLVAGEKNRYLTVDFPGDGSRPAVAPAPPGAPATHHSTGDTPNPPEPAPIRPAAWVFTGLTVVAGASFAYFGVTGKSQLDGLRASCAGHCGSSDVYSAWDKLIVADVSLGVGVVSAAAAAWFFLSPHHAESTSKSPAAAGFFVAPSPRGVETGWRGSF
jgi:hypothetical protein